MEQEHPLAYLAQAVASALGQDRPIRLALHNTERFGLVHLYFAHGRLIRVEGHRGSPQASLVDLAAWHAGTIRRDEGSSVAVPNASPSEQDAELAQALAQAIRSLEARGVIRPSAPGISQPGSRSTQSGPLWKRTPHTRPGISPLPPHPYTPAPVSIPPIMREMPQVEQVAGLPPLAHAIMPPDRPAPARDAEASGGALVSGPQWQLIALVTRQVVEQAGQYIGLQLAENLMRQALGQTATAKDSLRVVELDATGWLQAARSPEGKTITQYPTAVVVDAVATLLTNFEQRCAALVGAAQAQRVIAVATGPFRTSLAQIGLVVADEAVQ